MNVQEPTNDAEWITFVSPLVRIVEETDRSGSSPSNSRSAREGSNLSDDPKGKKTMSSETMSFGTPGYIAADERSFGLDGVWSSDLPNMQEDLFDSLMDFRGNK
jgi:hypothetical protein